MGEVDFSQNNLTATGLNALPIPWDSCKHLGTVKLYRNYLDDRSCDFICNLLEQCPTICGLHLSHNRLSASAIERIVETADRLRQQDDLDWDICWDAPIKISQDPPPLWLRIENNDVDDSLSLRDR